MSASVPKNQLIDQIEQLVAPVLLEQQAELVDLQFVHEHGGWVLRFFLDKTGGITLDDCALFSDKIGSALDAADIIAQAYSLEISSPGIYRALKKEKDFQKFIGERVDVNMFGPIEGRRHFKGTLQGAAQGQITLQDSEDRVYTLPISGIAKAHLDPDIKI